MVQELSEKVFKLSNDITELKVEFTKAVTPRSTLPANTVGGQSPSRPHSTPQLLPEVITLHSSLNMSNDNQKGDITDNTIDDNVPADVTNHSLNSNASTTQLAQLRQTQ